jgi:heterodisulfide reductase subunit A
MTILCPALVPSDGTARMAALLEVPTDRHGFIEELHGRMDSVRTKIRGVFSAGTCQAPMDTQKAVSQGLAATGCILSGLVTGRTLVVEPVAAEVDQTRCSGCRTCVPVCPYKAISFDGAVDAAFVNRVLCMGCGTCVAACPAGAMTGHHFTDEQIYAEIEQVLS